VPFDSLDQAIKNAEIVPDSIGEYYLTLFARWKFSLCEAWGIQPAGPIVNEPVSSDVPALILAGQFDPITPPAFATMAAETLNNNYLFEFPGLGHGILDSNACALKLSLQFLQDPHTLPDNPCFEDFQGPDFR